MVNKFEVKNMRERITDEIFNAFGLPRRGSMRRIFGGLFYLPTQRFARIMASADDIVGKEGLSSGCRSVLPDFNVHLQVHGSENIPKEEEGPLLIVSNHPGAYDSVALGSCVPRRDLRIFVGDAPFFRALPNASRCFIQGVGDKDPTGRMISLRESIETLRQGKSLLIFAGGTIDVDPAISGPQKADLLDWSPSVEIMLRKVPKTRFVPAIASGILLPFFAHHPLTWLRPGGVNKRRLSEFLQVLTQLNLPSTVQVHPRLTFAPPVSLAELEAESTDRRLMPAIQRRARTLLKEHMAVWYSGNFGDAQR
jgi:hypothetical protein